MKAVSFGSVGRSLLGVLVFVAALGLWEVWAISDESSFLFPRMSTVLEQAWHIWRTPEFLTDVTTSLKRLAAGYVIGVGIGVGVGLAMGSSRVARRTLEPVTEILRAIPPIAVVPVAIVVLGFGDWMNVSIIAFGVCFPVLIHSFEGVRAVPPEARDTASMLQVGPMERVFRIYLPAALPSIVAGMRVALSIGIVLVVISEFVGEGGGLGHYIIVQQTQFGIPEMYAGILFLGLLGYVLNRVFLLAERRVLAWHYGAAGERAR